MAISRIGSTTWATESLLICLMSGIADSPGGSPGEEAVKSKIAVTSRWFSGSGLW